MYAVSGDVLEYNATQSALFAGPPATTNLIGAAVTAGVDTVTLAAGDRVVVAGGVEWSGKSFGSTDRVDVYLPYEHRWTVAKPLRQARSDHGAVARFR